MYLWDIRYWYYLYVTSFLDIFRLSCTPNLVWFQSVKTRLNMDCILFVIFDLGLLKVDYVFLQFIAHFTGVSYMYTRVANVVWDFNTLLTNERYIKMNNWLQIFFRYKLLPTTSGPQKFMKIWVVKLVCFEHFWPIWIK